MERPLDALFSYTLEEERIVYQAEKRLIQRCMEEQGFRFPFPPFVDTPLPDRRYGITDEAQARIRGYGLDPRILTGDDPVQRYVDSLSPESRAAFDAALFGSGVSFTVRLPSGLVVTGSGGCTGLADEAIRGDRGEYSRLYFVLQDLRGQAAQAAAEDKRVRDVLQEWSSCMRGRGFDYATPSEAMTAVAGSGLEGFATPTSGPAGPGDLERQVAVADVQCKKEVDVVATWSGVESEHQARLLNDHEVELLLFAELRAQAIERATEIWGPDEG